MIIDRIENAGLYSALHPGIELCLRFIQETDLAGQAPFRKELRDGVTVGYSQYGTKAFDEKPWEAHDHCIDIQYVVDGRESLGYANREQMRFIERTEGKDKLVYTGDGARLLLEKGYFAILFPDDVHKSKLHTDGPKTVDKLVCKIKI